MLEGWLMNLLPHLNDQEVDHITHSYERKEMLYVRHHNIALKTYIDLTHV